MRIVCTKSNLVKGVSIVSKAVPSKTTMPILECILVDASTDVIKLTANDMELGIETRIEGDILERGIIALNAKIFSEIVRKLPDSDVVIETDLDFLEFSIKKCGCVTEWLQAMEPGQQVTLRRVFRLRFINRDAPNQTVKKR